MPFLGSLDAAGIQALSHPLFHRFPRPKRVTTAPLKNLVGSSRYSGVHERKLHLVAEAAKVSDESAGTLADCLRIGAMAALFVSNTLVQDLPCDTA